MLLGKLLMFIVSGETVKFCNNFKYQGDWIRTKLQSQLLGIVLILKYITKIPNQKKEKRVMVQKTDNKALESVICDTKHFVFGLLPNW